MSFDIMLHNLGKYEFYYQVRFWNCGKKFFTLSAIEFYTMYQLTIQKSFFLSLLQSFLTSFVDNIIVAILLQNNASLCRPVSVTEEGS